MRVGAVVSRTLACVFFWQPLWLVGWLWLLIGPTLHHTLHHTLRHTLCPRGAACGILVGWNSWLAGHVMSKKNWLLVHLLAGYHWVAWTHTTCGTCTHGTSIPAHVVPVYLLMWYLRTCTYGTACPESSPHRYPRGHSWRAPLPLACFRCCPISYCGGLRRPPHSYHHLRKSW